MFATLTNNTALYTILSQIALASSLESTLPRSPVSIDSNRLTENLTPLESALMKNSGEGGGGCLLGVRTGRMATSACHGAPVTRGPSLGHCGAAAPCTASERAESKRFNDRRFHSPAKDNALLMKMVISRELKDAALLNLDVNYGLRHRSSDRRHDGSAHGWFQRHDY